jgi:hypothetical protein
MAQKQGSYTAGEYLISASSKRAKCCSALSEKIEPVFGSFGAPNAFGNGHAARPNHVFGLAEVIYLFGP